MDTREKIMNCLHEQGVLPLYFTPDKEDSIKIIDTLYAAGIRMVEFTNRGKEALQNFDVLRKHCSAQLPGLYLGAGTIKTGAAASAFLDLGADFLVSPGLSDDVYDVAYSNKLLWIPGCMTATEIMRAEEYGINLVKLFPGQLLGPGYVTAVRDIFPEMQFMPTGGVDLTKENLQGWFNAGVYAVGLGSKLLSKELITKKDFSKIRMLTEEVQKTISAIRSQK